MNKRIENLCAIAGSFVAAVLFGFNSPLHPWIGKECLTDSSVFKTVALMMQRGYLPYRDTFDHKGPLLYIINLIGNIITYYKGIWVIEIITLMVTFFVMFKIGRIFTSVLSSFVAVFTSVSLLFVYYEGGNLTEEYAMPFIAISLYIFLDYFENYIINRKRLVLAGVCLGAILMLRPNMISLWVVFCIAVICLMLHQGKIQDLLFFTGWFLGGVLAVCFPICLWLLIKGDFAYFIQDYILFNIRYSSKEGGNALLQQKWIAFFVFSNTKLYTIAILSTLFHLKNKKVINISYALYLVLTVIMMVMSGMQFKHYGMILIPAFVYPISLLFADLEHIREKSVSTGLVMLLALYMLSVIALPYWQDLFMKIETVYEERNDNHVDYTVNGVVDVVKNLTNQNDSISVYGNWNIIYVLAQRTHATRYSFQMPIGNMMPELMDEYIAQLREEQPPVIVVSKGCYDDRIRNYLDNYHYELNYISPDSEGNESNNLLDCALVFKRTL